jgi:hypothetical protein
VSSPTAFQVRPISHHALSHTGDSDIPWVLAGAGGYFKTGRYLQYRDQPHNNLLVSVCNAMGLADVTTFGVPELCTGPLTGLTG